MAEIDPSIALSYRPPNLAALPNLQVQTPLESLARVVSLRSLMQEGELKGLQLQQLRTQMQEQQNLADLMRSVYGDTTATGSPGGPPPPLSAAPVQPYTPQPAVPSAAPMAGGAPVTPVGVDVTAGLDKYLTPAAVTPQPSPQPAPQTVAPVPQSPTVSAPQLMGPAPATASGAPLGWPSQYPTPGQILRAAPITGPALITQLTNQQKDLLDLHIKNQTIAKGQTEDMVRLANGAQDNESLQRNLAEMAHNGYITSDQARQYSALGFDDPKTKAWLNSVQMSAVTADKQQEMRLALARDAREGKMFDPQYAKAVKDQQAAEYEDAKNRASDLTDESQLPGFLASLGPYAAQRYAYLLSSNIPIEQKKRAIEMGAGGEQKVAEAAATTTATERAKYDEQLKQDEPTIQGVVNGTIKWENVSPATQERIQSEVQRRLTQQQTGAPGGAAPGGAPAGVPGSPVFGKPISSEQRTQLGNYDRAYTILDQTEADLKNPDKTSTMGPIVGDIANLRWAVKTREFRDLLVARALQLKNYLTSTGRVNPEIMKLVDQVFPTIKTQPEEALAKIQQLKAMIAGERASAVRDMGGLAIPEELRQPPSAGGAPAPGPPAPAPAPAAAPAPTPAPALTQPPAPAKTSPLPSTATKAPADVQDFLKDRPWGRYKLNDGRVFYKTKDGRIVPFQ